MFCLMPETSLKFKQAIKDGKIDPGKMAKMTSAERNEFLGTIVGKNHAQAVNSLFESKLLLKNQKKGMVTWAKQVSGIKPAARRDLIAKIERMQTVLDPEDSRMFMRDLTETRLGVGVSDTEAKIIADLSKKVTDTEALRSANKTFPSKEVRMDYGYAVEDLTEYVSSLKKSADRFRASDLTRPSGSLITKFASRTAGNMKSLSASLDNSAVFRQGWKLLFTDTNIWRKNAVDTFITGAKELGGKNVLRAVNADIISRPNYDRMVRARLAVKNPEEAFPESLTGKIPYVRRLYKASESAFTGFQYKNRADVFDKYLEIAKKNGVDIDDTTQLRAIGKLVNSLTGRGDLGKAEVVANEVNNIFFSPRFLKANLDTLTAHQLQKDVTPFVRKKAATNLVKVVAGTATVLALADALMPGSVEWDSRSSDFGKIRVKDTRFDVSGGMASIITLVSRVVPTHDPKSKNKFIGVEGWGPKSKSASSGKITDLNSDEFGARSWDDVVMDFFRNKLSPAASAGVHTYEGKDFNGNDTNILKEIGRTAIPIGVQNANELLTNPNAANALIGIIADGLGIGTNTYSASGGGHVSTWSKSDSKDLKAFKDVVGEEKFNSLAKTYDDDYNAWIARVMDEPKYQDMTTDEKTSLIQQKKAALKKAIFKSSGFEYKAPKKTTTKDPLLNP